jgi:hypothetical protein
MALSTISTINFMNNNQVVVNNNLGRWIALGRANNMIAYSDDNGVNWVGLGSSIFSIYGLCVVSNGSIIVSGGGGGINSNTLAHSSDGINWIALGNSMFGEWCQRIAWSPTLNLFVAVGTGGATHARSSNGINWTGSSAIFTEGRGVGWGNGMFIMVGVGAHSFARSTDGINWTAYTSKTIFSTRGFNVAYNGQIWVAVGQGTNSIAHSSDGITWTGLGLSIFSTWGLGIVWSQSLNLWVAVGQGTNSIAYSSSGINWTGLGTSIFTVSKGVSWNGSRFVAVGDGSNDPVSVLE